MHWRALPTGAVSVSQAKTWYDWQQGRPDSSRSTPGCEAVNAQACTVHRYAEDGLKGFPASEDGSAAAMGSS